MGEDENKDIAAHYGLPGIEIYPQNKWGDIARREGANTANQWAAVKDAVYKGRRDFMEDPRTQFIMTTMPVSMEGAIIDGAAQAMPAIKSGVNHAARYSPWLRNKLASRALSKQLKTTKPITSNTSTTAKYSSAGVSNASSKSTITWSDAQRPKNYSEYERVSNLSSAEKAGASKHERNAARNTRNLHTREAYKLKENTDHLSLGSVEDMGPLRPYNNSKDITTKFDNTMVSVENPDGTYSRVKASGQYIDDVPNLRESFNSIINNRQDYYPEFAQNNYINYFNNMLDRQGILFSKSGEMLKGANNMAKKENVAKVLSQMYDDVVSGQTGLAKGKIFTRHGNQLNTRKFNWQGSLGRNTGNGGFLGGGNYFHYGAPSGQNDAYLIDNVTKIGHDLRFGARNAENAKLMDKLNTSSNVNANSFMNNNKTGNSIVMSNGVKDIPSSDFPQSRYGSFQNADGSYTDAHELVTNTNRIKSLIPDLKATATGSGFKRNWSNRDPFKAVIGVGGTAAGLKNFDSYE